MESSKKFELTPEQLRRRCDPKLFQFECTKDLAPLREFIGQERAIRAVEFGLNMVNDGYNLFVTGLSGTGKTSVVKTYIEKLIKERERNGQRFELEDLCYLYNFKEPDRPKIVGLQQGQGKVFKGQMADLLTSVRAESARVFSSEEYKNQRKKVVEECQARGLTGDQGVMIPNRNIKNLMLREEVVDAVKQGKFHIYAAGTIDEGIQVLTGVPAGRQSEDGSYAEGTVNYLVSQKLAGMAEKLKSFAGAEEKKTNGFRREPIPARKSGQGRDSQ